MSVTRQAYAAGFMRKCAERGVDPSALIKAAQAQSTATRAGAYTANALNLPSLFTAVPGYVNRKSDNYGKGLASTIAAPAASMAGAAPGASLFTKGLAQHASAVKPVTSMQTGRMLGSAIPKGMGRIAVGGKAKMLAGAVAALIGGAVAGGETTYALSQK